MGLFLEKKWPPLILAAYLAVAILGIFTLAAVEPLRSVDFLENKILSDASIIQQDLNADTPIEGEPVITNGRGYSFSALRNGSLRTIVALGTRDAGYLIAQTPVNATQKTNHFTIKNTIHLKLRI
jgi:hypothetical protein